jgi:aspartate kinase
MSVVMKFGGTSVADAAAMRQAADAVAHASGRAPLVVLSAMAGVTDDLLHCVAMVHARQPEAAHSGFGRILQRHADVAAELLPADSAGWHSYLALLGEHEHEFRAQLERTANWGSGRGGLADAVASHGERLSSALFAALLRSRGLDCEWVDAAEFVRTDAQFTRARPERDAIGALAAERLGSRLRPGRVVVTQGFVGATEGGERTTLGRGASDCTATLLGAALGVEEIQIWTDVEGVLTADPRVVADARTVPSLSYAEADTLASLQARVLHAAMILPAVEADIPVSVRCTARPSGGVTVIRREAAAPMRVSGEVRARAVAARGGLQLLQVRAVPGRGQFLARALAAIARPGVDVDLVEQQDQSLQLVVDAEVSATDLVRRLAEVGRVDVRQGRALLALVGSGLDQDSARHASASLRGLPTDLFSMQPDRLRIVAVLPQALAATAIRRGHAAVVAAPAHSAAVAATNGTV